MVDHMFTSAETAQLQPYKVSHCHPSFTFNINHTQIHYSVIVDRRTTPLRISSTEIVPALLASWQNHTPRMPASGA